MTGAVATAKTGAGVTAGAAVVSTGTATEVAAGVAVDTTTVSRTPVGIAVAVDASGTTAVSRAVAASVITVAGDATSQPLCTRLTWENPGQPGFSWPGSPSGGQSLENKDSRGSEFFAPTAKWLSRSP